MMLLEPMQRVEAARETSEVDYYQSLLWFAEYISKLMVLGLLSSIEPHDAEERISLFDRLLKATSVGGWAGVADSCLTGPAAKMIIAEARPEVHALADPATAGSWQYRAVDQIYESLREAGAMRSTPRKARVFPRLWFTLIASARNHSKGHGWLTPERLSKALPGLEASVHAIAQNYPLFGRSVIYLRYDSEDKPQVMPLNGSPDPFVEHFGNFDDRLPVGVYAWYGKPVGLECITVDPDRNDLFLPNGNYAKGSYEEISYISNERQQGNAARFTVRTAELRDSDTQGFSALEARGNTLTNAPPAIRQYVRRERLETDVLERLCDDRTRVVTLKGRGGVGKTSLALTVLEELAILGDFYIILWFSSRNVDLLPSGPKNVKARILSRADVSRQWAAMVHPELLTKPDREIVTEFQAVLRTQAYGPTLFVFDNFETINEPETMFDWLESAVRLPNKILITTRFATFRGDYEIPIGGMSYEEALELIELDARELKVDHLLTKPYRDQLIEDSGGHPYILRILLGGIKRTGKVRKLQNVLARSTEVLIALFESTYVGLAGISQLTFLTLCAARTVVPRIALEAVLRRHAKAEVVDEALEELTDFSMVETRKIGSDGEEYFVVPIAASEFGISKMKASPLQPAVDDNVELLSMFGPLPSELSSTTLKGNIRRFFANVERAVTATPNPASITHFIEVLEYASTRYPEFRLTWAQMLARIRRVNWAVEAIRQVERYLETAEGPDRIDGLRELVELGVIAPDVNRELYGLVQLAQYEQTPFSDVRDTATRIMRVLRQQPQKFNKYERNSILRAFLPVLERRIVDAGTAGEFARVGWLYLLLDPPNSEEARRWAERGMERDPDNEHCRKLVDEIAAWH